MPPAYEIRPSVIRGLGLFALRDLKAGDPILKEPIVMEVSKDTRHQTVDPHDMYRGFKRNPPDIQEQILQLTGRSYGTETDMIVRSLRSLDPPERDEAVAVASRFMNNAFGDGDRQWLSIDTSRINHSCIPNACARRDGHEQTVHAIRTITAGDEIIISYCRLAGPASHRRERLKKWNIACVCEACSLTTEESKDRDAKLTELQRLLDELKKQRTAENYKEALRLTWNMPELVGCRASL